ncbi:MAG: nicotinate-nucleotide--dimethylbenzimidazole phosphoribosyltransferase [Aquabacterium sp.]
MSLLQSTIARIGPLDAAAQTSARDRQGQLTKPPGALGRLEALSVQVAGITGSLRPPLDQRAVIVMAGDHGVARQGVSAYPSDVTAQMVLNFLAGGAAVNVLALQVGARVRVVDVGVASPLPAHPDLVSRRVADGTADLTLGPAMTQAQAIQAIEAGIEVVTAEHAAGLHLVATGEMGIGNTTPSAALTCAFTGADPSAATGRGTGIDDDAWRRKVAVVERGLALHQPNAADGLGTLAALGGFEIAGLVGVILGAAALRVPVVIDGFISTAAALAAVAIAPAARPYLIASHRSAEQGHAIALSHLGLQPLLELDMRLGEGTGALLAFPLVEAAVRTLNEMATFAEAGVSGPADPNEPGPDR